MDKRRHHDIRKVPVSYCGSISRQYCLSFMTREAVSFVCECPRSWNHNSGLMGVWRVDIYLWGKYRERWTSMGVACWWLEVWWLVVCVINLRIEYRKEKFWQKGHHFCCCYCGTTVVARSTGGTSFDVFPHKRQFQWQGNGLVYS